MKSLYSVVDNHVGDRLELVLGLVRGELGLPDVVDEVRLREDLRGSCEQIGVPGEPIERVLAGQALGR